MHIVHNTCKCMHVIHFMPNIGYKLNICQVGILSIDWGGIRVFGKLTPEEFQKEADSRLLFAHFSHKITLTIHNKGLRHQP